MAAHFASAAQMMEGSRDGVARGLLMQTRVFDDEDGLGEKISAILTVS
jgi:hypothetical protein